MAEIRADAQAIREAGDRLLKVAQETGLPASHGFLEDLALVVLASRRQPMPAIDDAMVEAATMSLLGKAKDPVPGIDWWASRQWRVSKVRQKMRQALAVALGQN